MATTTENKMQYTRLGSSGLKVSKIILGCASYGGGGWMLDEEQSIEHIKAAYDLGINTFDTADIYGNGESEIFLGKAIKKYNLPRDEIVVMSKAWGPVGRGREIALMLSKEDLGKKRYTNQYGLSRKHLFDAIKHTLERLQLDYVDVYTCHRFDPETPIEETMQAMHDIVKAGYARYIGMSSCYAWQFYKMQSYARQHGLTEFICMTNLHNAIYREDEREMIPMLQDLGVGMIPYSPQARGALSKPLDVSSARKEIDVRRAALQDVPYLEAINKKIQAIAEAHGVSMSQVALAWSLSKDFVTAPIIGTTSIETLKDGCGAVDLKLTEEEVKAIDDFYQPRAIFGH